MKSMSAKDMVLDFLNYSFLLFLIITFFLYFVVGDRFAAFTRTLQMMAPFSFFGIIFLIRLKILRMRIKKRKSDNSMDMSLELNYFDKLKDEIVIFSLPIVVIGLAYMTGSIDTIDFLQALMVFVIMISWHTFLFSKEE